MAINNPDLGPVAPQSVLEAGSPESAPFSQHHLIFSADDPRLTDMTIKQRVQQYYARELALGNMDVFAPRYRASDHESDNPWADISAPDPLSDPQVSEIATQLRIAGISRELSELVED